MEVRNLGGAPSSRVFPVRGDDSMDFLFLLRVSGEMSADGAPPFVRALCCPRPSAHSDSFAPLWAKGSRTQVVGSVREAPWGPPLRGALLVLFSRQGEKSTHINLPNKPKFTSKSHRHRNRLSMAFLYFMRNTRLAFSDRIMRLSSSVRSMAKKTSRSSSCDHMG